MLRKQIAMIIPTCRPLTALKHPSIRPRRNKALSPALCHVPPVPPHRSRCPPAPNPRTPFTHHDVSTVCGSRSKDGCALWPAPRWKRCPGHSSFCGAGSVWENTWGSFCELWPHSWTRERTEEISLSPARPLRLRAVVPSEDIELYRGCDWELEGIQHIETTALKVCVSREVVSVSPLCLFVGWFVCLSAALHKNYRTNSQGNWWKDGRWAKKEPMKYPGNLFILLFDIARWRFLMDLDFKSSGPSGPDPDKKD